MQLDWIDYVDEFSRAKAPSHNTSAVAGLWEALGLGFESVTEDFNHLIGCVVHRLLPLKLEVFMRLSTVAQVEINQALIGKVFFFRQVLEIRDGIFIQADRDLLFKLLGVWVFD